MIAVIKYIFILLRAMLRLHSPVVRLEMLLMSCADIIYLCMYVVGIEKKLVLFVILINFCPFY